MRKLASIVEIGSCTPIENTDRLSVATMRGKGWRVVVGRDQFKPGDRAVYFEIDSFLPADDPRYAFLAGRCLRKFVSKSGKVLDQGIRIKTVWIRDVASQGLIMPLSAFPEIPDPPIFITDVTDLLRVRDYNEIAEVMTYWRFRNKCDMGESPFPSFIPKTGEERLQHLRNYFNDPTLRDVFFEVTELRNGKSCTVSYSPMIDTENPFIVCSRDFRLKPKSASGEVPLFWRVAKKYDLQNKLSKFPDFAFQFEVCGPEIRFNRDRLAYHTMEVFRIWDIKNQRFILPDERRDICKYMDIPHVPVINPAFQCFKEWKSIDDALAMANGSTKHGNRREGLVFKETVADNPRTFKVVSNRYLLGK